PPRAFLRVEPLVGEPERLARVLRLVWNQHRAEGARHVEPLAAFGEGETGQIDERLRRAGAHGRDEAELVAPETVRGAFRARPGGELAAEAGEERVARGVAEAVVVALEAVQVEEHQQRRSWAPRREAALEVEDE